MRLCLGTRVRWAVSTGCCRVRGSPWEHYGRNGAPGEVGLCIRWVLDDRWEPRIDSGPACLNGRSGRAALRRSSSVGCTGERRREGVREGERERDINIDYASLQGSHDSDDLILAHLLVTY